MAFSLDDRSQRLIDVDEILRDHFPLPVVLGRLNPVSQLVKGLLGTKTRSVASYHAMRSLKAHFGTWEAVRDAPVEDVLSHLKGILYAEKKADSIKSLLSALTGDDGRITLDHLNALTTREAMVWLQTIKGIGPKIAASILNAFTMRRRSLVVDSHHLRVAWRVGLTKPRADFVAAYKDLMPLIPECWSAERIDDHHRLVKRLGQTYCRPSSPNCRDCPVNPLCDFPKANENRTSLLKLD